MPGGAALSLEAQVPRTYRCTATAGLLLRLLRGPRLLACKIAIKPKIGCCNPGRWAREKKSGVCTKQGPSPPQSQSKPKDAGSLSLSCVPIASQSVDESPVPPPSLFPFPFPPNLILVSTPAHRTLLELQAYQTAFTLLNIKHQIGLTLQTPQGNLR